MDNPFVKIYRENLWRGKESRSGVGSDLERTVMLRTLLPKFLSKYNVRTILDAPCGDTHWLRHCELELDRYQGIDIVKDVVEANSALDFSFEATFDQGDIREDILSPVDLILCRDGLVHLSNREVLEALMNFKRSGARYLLATTYPACGQNYDIETSWWRPIDLTKSPFDLPPPLDFLDEFRDHKVLGLWYLADIDVVIDSDRLAACPKIDKSARSINLRTSELL